MIEAPHFSAAGAKKKAVALPATLFDGTVNEDALHRAVVTYLANQRQGTHQTKTRHFVTGGNQKPWRQKGTGRARQGSTRAPHWRHGGVAFGPHPRDYRLGIPKKLRQLARKSALNARAREGALVVVDPLAFEKPKTKALAELLVKVGVADRKVVVLTAGSEAAHNVYLSGRNIPGVHVTRFADATAYEILWADPVVTEQSSAAYAARKEYAFKVHPEATKPQIKAAIEALFKVTVTDVRTLVVRAKRRTYGRYQGVRPSWKKAIVTLKDGDAIQVFEG